jgi:hypothetical protein
MGRLEENLDLFGKELKLKQEQAASGVAEAFDGGVPLQAS